MEESAEVTIQITDIRRSITKLDAAFTEFREKCNLKFEALRFWKIAWTVVIAVTFGLSGYFVAALRQHEASAYHVGIPAYVKSVTAPMTEQMIDNQLGLKEVQVNYINLQVQMDRIEKKLDKIIDGL